MTVLPPITWMPSTRGLRRGIVVEPGFVCPADHPECAGKPKGHQHGRSGDSWIYVVTDGRFAISIGVGTPHYRGSRLLGHGFWAREIQTHSRSQEHEGQAHFPACRFVDGGSCFSGIYSLAAEQFWRAWGRERLEQDELFWRALEDKREALRPPDVVMATFTG